MRLQLKGPSEKEVENSILEYLTKQRDLNILAFKVNTTGVFDPNKKTFRKLSKYVIPGTPDILICMEVSGLPIFIGFEVKCDTGKQSVHQKAFESELKKRKGFYFIVRSIGEAHAALHAVRDEILSQI